MKHPNDRYYLVELQYLGFRYHGWQKQPNVKTVQGMVEKTLNFVLGDKPFKILGLSRTDAMVSAEYSGIQLMLREEVDEEAFLNDLNINLPADIRAIAIKKVDLDFNIIQQVDVKEYWYLFSFGEKFHPFCAPYMANVTGQLDIDLMKKAAATFVGEHDFSAFCDNDDAKTAFVRTIDKCEIVINDVVTASFFPKESYILKIASKGFLRYQVRYVMVFV